MLQRTSFLKSADAIRRLKAQKQEGSRRDKWNAAQQDALKSLGIDCLTAGPFPVRAVMDHGDLQIEYYGLVLPLTSCANAALRKVVPGSSQIRRRWTAWTQRHRGIRQSQLPKLPRSSYPKVKPCFFAGVCFCRTASGITLCQPTTSFQSATRQLFKQGSVAKELYTKGLCILRLHSPEEQ